MRSSKRHVWVRNAETGNYELDVDPSLFITANQLETLSIQGMAENEDIMAMAKRNKSRGQSSVSPTGALAQPKAVAIEEQQS